MQIKDTGFWLERQEWPDDMPNILLNSTAPGISQHQAQSVTQIPNCLITYNLF